MFAIGSEIFSTETVIDAAVDITHLLFDSLKTTSTTARHFEAPHADGCVQLIGAHREGGWVCNVHYPPMDLINKYIFQLYLHSLTAVERNLYG